MGRVKTTYKNYIRNLYSAATVVKVIKSKHVIGEEHKKMKKIHKNLWKVTTGMIET